MALGLAKPKEMATACVLLSLGNFEPTELSLCSFQLLPEPAVLSSARYRHHKNLSDPRFERPWLSRPLQRLLLRVVLLVASSIFLFLMFLRVHKPSKQAVEDFIKWIPS